ncbi:MAG: DUF6502 family protein, partial [Steroidobacteraceae bacterium]
MTSANPQSNLATAGNSSTSAEEGISESARILLRRVFRILRGCGIKEDELRRMAGEAVSEIERIPDTRPSRVTARQALMCCDVVLKWRRDCNFLDSQGMPAHLSLDGPAKSFADLVSASAPGEDAHALLATMLELGVVRITESKKIELISESVVA